jgi:hypothetical protein
MHRDRSVVFGTSIPRYGSDGVTADSGARDTKLPEGVYRLELVNPGFNSRYHVVNSDSKLLFVPPHLE